MLPTNIQIFFLVDSFSEIIHSCLFAQGPPHTFWTVHDLLKSLKLHVVKQAATRIQLGELAFEFKHDCFYTTIPEVKSIFSCLLPHPVTHYVYDHKSNPQVTSTDAQLLGSNTSY